jgi:hypothetical protein
MDLRELVRLGLRKYLRRYRDASKEWIPLLEKRETDWFKTEHEEEDDTLEELVEYRKKEQLLLVSYEQGMLSPETWLESNDPIPEAMEYWNSRYLHAGDYTSESHSRACFFISMCCSKLFSFADLWEQARGPGHPTVTQNKILRAYINKNIHNYKIPVKVDDIYTEIGRIWEDFKGSDDYHLQRLVENSTVQTQLRTTEVGERLIQCITNAVIRSFDTQKCPR